VYLRFDSIPAFEGKVEDEFWERMIDIGSGKEARIKELMELAEIDLDLSTLLKGLNEEELLRVGGQYRLLKDLRPDLSKARIKQIAQRNNPDSVARLIVEDSLLKMGHVETAAASLGIFDDLWPMYRFENTDLRLAT